MSHPFDRTAYIHYDVVAILWQGLYVSDSPKALPVDFRAPIVIQASGGLLLPGATGIRE